MSVVSYRLYCEECASDIVLREDEMADHEWKVVSKANHAGLCPACNDAVDLDEDSEYSAKYKEVAFEELDNIGEAGAENLRAAGIVTREHVMEASDEEILDVSWVGEGGLKSIRQTVR